MMAKNQEQFVISITSRDRIGIVYEISKAISELNGNIADIRQSVLCGYFTMILLASFPAKITERSIERKLAEVDAHSETAIQAMVKKVEESAPSPSSSDCKNTYVLTATGKDKIGFVATVSSFCVNHHINILDLSTTVSDGAYVMILMVDLKKCDSISAVRLDLQQFAQQAGVTAVLQHYDIFKAVNEINLPLL
jgi:glycine cleavage system transcriptional repressor